MRSHDRGEPTAEKDMYRYGTPVVFLEEEEMISN